MSLKSVYPRLKFACVYAACIFPLFAAMYSPAACAQTASGVVFTQLYSFSAATSSNHYINADGAYPYAGLTFGKDGNLWGATDCGGSGGTGTLFTMTPAGALTPLHSFGADTTPANSYTSINSDGESSDSALTVGLNGNLYGTRAYGGPTGSGTVFEITPSGTFTLLYVFSADNSGSSTGNSDGADPWGGLSIGPNGNFYDTTALGGASDDGTIFEMTPTGALTQLYVFSAEGVNGEYGNADGAAPWTGLTLASDGNFYGVTTSGGSEECGEFFRVTPAGAFTALSSFGASTASQQSEEPIGQLVEGTGGNLYGTTLIGHGSIYKATLTGTLSTLYDFPGTAGPAYLYSGLVQGSDGNFYGTSEGSPSGDGTVFQVTPSGVETVLHTFGGTDGENPYGNLAIGSDGALYGVTFAGGANNTGVIFKLTVPGLTGPVPSLSSFAFNPSAVTGGNSSTGKITLSSAAPTSGVTVSLTSSSSSVIVPASVIVAGGATSATFTATTSSVTTTATATVTATYNGASKTASLTVNPAKTPVEPVLSSVSLSPASVIGGSAASTANRVHLTGNAAATMTITLKSSNTAVATLPATVTVQQGYSSHVFTVTTKATASPQTVTITATSGGVSKTATLTVIPAVTVAPTRFDFNHDGHADLIWYNTGSGALSVWDMDDQQVLSYGASFTQLAPSSGWQPVAAPDVNNDGVPDLIWWNSQSGELSAWTLAAGAPPSVSNYGGDFATLSDTTWKPVAAADVTGTTWELVFQNTASGDISVWQMNGATVTSFGGSIGSVGSGTGWQVVGAPDLNGDGHSDLLFWNSQTGEVAWWSCNLANQQVLSYNGDFAQVSDTSWHLVGSEDTNGDGHPDLIWWNATSGSESRWLLNGTTVTQYGGTSTQVSDTTWQPTAIR